MRCANCPLFTSWNTENDRGESCGLFGDSWDNAFQYEDKEGAIVGCYIDRHFIVRRDAEYTEMLSKWGEDMEDTPTVVPSVPEGEWLPRTDYNGSLWWECSRCGYKASDDDIPFNYCPECGAQNGGV